MKKNVLVVGMGQFGRRLADQMQELGNAVMIVDVNAEIIEELAPRFLDAQIADCTRENVVRALDVGQFDICFVAIGDNFAAAMMIVSVLKSEGAKYVVAKANKELQAKLLSRVGADEVLYPEREAADRAAAIYSNDRIFNFLELTGEYSVYEIAVPSDWIGKALFELDVRRRYGVNIVAIKSSEKLMPTPDPAYCFREGDHVMIIGKAGGAFRLAARK